MVRYWCECEKCGGAQVGKTTWYRHNEERKRRNPFTTYVDARTKDNHTPGVSSSAPSDVYVKELSPEDIDLGGNVKRAARSDSVGVVRQSNLCPLGPLTFV
jgi:hypothetical protein